jgi:tetratricopeptide (TPR) repeat protein
MLPLNAPPVDIASIAMEVRLETVEIMTLQCHAWLKLRRYADLGAEVERWNFVPHNDAAAQAPDWLPWSLRKYIKTGNGGNIFSWCELTAIWPLLLATLVVVPGILAGQIQQYTENSDRASDIIFAIRDHIPQEEAVWLTTIDNALANLFLRQSNWRLALGSMDRILEQIPLAAQQYVKQNYPNTTNSDEKEEILAAAFRCEILSRQGRTLLQIGALPEVTVTFEAATQVWASIEPRIPSELKNHNLLKILPIQMEVNRGLVDFANSQYDLAMGSFSRAVDIIRSHGILAEFYDPENWMGPSVAGSEALTVVYAECVNNMALCALYQCRMQDAVDFLEGLIREDPSCFLTERSAFNLCTLYELGGDSATSVQRKRMLQLIAKRFFLHDVGQESFRVN